MSIGIDELQDLQEARADAVATMKQLGSIDVNTWTDEQRSQWDKAERTFDESRTKMKLLQIENDRIAKSSKGKAATVELEDAAEAYEGPGQVMFRNVDTGQPVIGLRHDDRYLPPCSEQLPKERSSVASPIRKPCLAIAFSRPSGSMF